MPNKDWHSNSQPTGVFKTEHIVGASFSQSCASFIARKGSFVWVSKNASYYRYYTYYTSEPWAIEDTSQYIIHIPRDTPQFEQEYDATLGWQDLDEMVLELGQRMAEYDDGSDKVSGLQLVIAQKIDSTQLPNGPNWIIIPTEPLRISPLTPQLKVGSFLRYCVAPVSTAPGRPLGVWWLRSGTALTATLTCTGIIRPNGTVSLTVVPCAFLFEPNWRSRDLGLADLNPVNTSLTLAKRVTNIGRPGIQASVKKRTSKANST
ncbi:hypothetical protein BDR22DRAFT_967438 [Usnea florida]